MDERSRQYISQVGNDALRGRVEVEVELNSLGEENLKRIAKAYTKVPAETVELALTRVKKGWVFPKERFVTYEPKDEQWCRYCGIGHEGVIEETVTIPNAIVTGVSPDGTIHFKPLLPSQKWGRLSI